MKLLIITLLLISSARGMTTEIVTISPDKYSFNVNQATVTIMMPETKKATLADCIYERENEEGYSYEDALTICTENN